MASKHPNGIYYYREADGGIVASSIDVGHIYPNEISPDDPDVADDWNAYLAQEYARNRVSEYPPIGDQLDMIYKDMKNGTTTHAEAVEAVKTKHPKG